MAYILWLVLSCFLYLRVKGCPDTCQCTENEVRCRNSGMTDLDSFSNFTSPENVTRIDLSENRLHEFDCRELKDTFQQLEVLLLNENNLQQVPSRLQDCFPRLQNVQISRNNISSVHRLNLTTVTRLDLSENAINFLSDNSFTSNCSLEDLDLSFNRLAKVEGKALYGLRLLKTANLNGNRLHRVPPTLFKHCLSLKTMSIASNYLTSIASYLLPRKVSNVYLQGNKISKFGQQMLADVKGRHMDLSNNRLKKLSSHFLQTAKLYERIDLTGNPVDCTCDVFDAFDNADFVGTCGSPVQAKGRLFESTDAEMLDCIACEGCHCTDSCDRRNLTIILCVCIPSGIILLAVLAYFIRKKKQQGAFSCLGTQICCCCCVFSLVAFAVASLLMWVLLFMYQDDDE